MILRKFLLSILLAISSTVMAATTFSVDGFTYSKLKNGTVEVKNGPKVYSITIPDSVVYNDTTYIVTGIGEGAFYNSEVYAVITPKTLKYIAINAFTGSSLTNITLLEGLDSIAGSFCRCHNLVNIELPSTLKHIEKDTFYSCTSLCSINIPNGVNVLEDATFSGCTALTNITLPSSLYEIGVSCFKDCHSLTEIDLPESLVQIGDYAFQNTGLKEINIPSKISKIESYTFKDCRYLKKVNFSSNLQQIEHGAFENCESLQAIALPMKTRLLGLAAFANCKSLKEIFIPESLISMGTSSPYSFDGCDSIINMHVRSTVPVNFGEKQFVHANSDSAAMTLYVPVGLKETYSKLSCYAGFGKIVEENIGLEMESQRRLIIGTKAKLNIIPKPSIYPLGDLTWTSSNKRVATVDAYGNVIAIAQGNTIISASMIVNKQKIEARCNVDVVAEPIANFAINEFKCSVGSNTYLPVELINDSEIISFQCDIYLPNGMKLFTDEEDYYDFTWGGRQTRRHILESRLQADGSIRVVGYAPDNSAFKDNVGTLFNIPIVPPSVIGDYDITIRNILVTDKQLKEHPLMDLTKTIYVGSKLLGDANSDGRLTINDAAYASAYILGETFDGFNFTAADVIADNSITMADVSEIINLVLSAPINSPAKRIMLISRNNPMRDGDLMYLEDINLSAGQTATLEIKMKNDEPFISFHSEIILPEGLSFVEEDGEYCVDLAPARKTRSHTIASRLQEDGRLRVVSYSSNNSAFKGNDGVLFTVEIKANDDFDDSKPCIIKLENNYIVNRDENSAKDYDVADCSCKVNGISTSVDFVSEKAPRIYVTGGNMLNIDSVTSTTVILSTIDGVTRQLDIVAGHNCFVVERPGIYIVDTTKVVIR